jgi:hypothetical protein
MSWEPFRKTADEDEIVFTVMSGLLKNAIWKLEQLSETGQEYFKPH